MIDAHQHFWRTAAQEQPWRDRTHTMLAADFEPADLAPELQAAGVRSTVLVQSVDEPAENDRLADYARSDLVAGVVAWLPLSQPESARAELRRISRHKVCGVRCIIGRDPLDWLTTGKSLDLFGDLADQNLVWDVVPITQAQIKGVVRLAEKVPELRIAVGHLARPPLDTEAWQPWAANIERLASCENITLKVSVGMDVLTSWDSWCRDDILPYIGHAAEKFGASRLMAASNWPIVLIRTSYQQAWGELRAAIEGVFPGHHDRQFVLGGTAQRWYGLPPPGQTTT